MFLFPHYLQSMLQDSESVGPVMDFAFKASVILRDNKLPFFPAYTDHGPQHIARILETQVDLIPDSARGHLGGADAAVMICAAVLHDISMHIREDGFLALIRGETPHVPVRWFDKRQEKRPGDPPWPALWRAYESEARRFSDHTISRIVGQDFRKDYSFAGLRERPGQWVRGDYLIIGEFIRRHHARLAHEIALHGFPGLEEREFPDLSKSLEKLANLAGVVARSHGEPLRLSLAYLERMHRGDLKPRGAFAVYLMALLRIADFLQMDAERAPTALLRLRNPQSPASIDEWNKHGSVAHISYTDSDPHAIRFELGTRHGLRTHMQMEALLDGLQQELDASAAVLDEVYGRAIKEGFQSLRLDKTRVSSNIHDPELHEELDYVPFPVEFHADPMILPLLVEPLYGDAPHYGLRELLQNAVDAVREREAYCDSHRFEASSIEFFDQSSDIVIELERFEDRSWVIRITDKGIGMTPTIVRDFYLRVGASFRSSKEWADEYLDEHGQSTVHRSGRFGVGVFATFLLGNTLRVRTRHVQDRTGKGLEFEATRDADIAELRRREMPVGTQIEIPLKGSIRRTLIRRNWYTMAKPTLSRRVILDGHLEEEIGSKDLLAPHPNEDSLPAEWRRIRPEGFEAVLWTDEAYPSLTCNGIRIAEFRVSKKGHKFIDPHLQWTQDAEFDVPNIAVFDPNANLPLTLSRERLRGSMPFEDALLNDVSLDFFAYLIVMAPENPEGLFQRSRGTRSYRLFRHRPWVNWIASELGVAPAYPRIVAYNAELSSLRVGIGKLAVDEMWKDFRGAYCHLDQKGNFIRFPQSAWGEQKGRSTEADEESLVNHLSQLAQSAAKVALQIKRDFEEEFTGADWLRVTRSIVFANERGGTEVVGALGLENVASVARSRYYDKSWFDHEMDVFEDAQDLRRALESMAETKRQQKEFKGMDAERRRRELQAQLSQQPAIVEVRLATTSDAPTASLLIELWEQYVGSRWLPFDARERQAVLEKARSNEPLRRRIDAWIKVRDAEAHSGRKT